MADEIALREGLVVNEEEYKEYGVGSRESDASDHVNCLCHSDRMWRLFFANLDEARLKKIIKQINGRTR